MRGTNLQAKCILINSTVLPSLSQLTLIFNMHCLELLILREKIELCRCLHFITKHYFPLLLNSGLRNKYFFFPTFSRDNQTLRLVSKYPKELQLNSHCLIHMADTLTVSRFLKLGTCPEKDRTCLKGFYVPRSKQNIQEVQMPAILFPCKPCYRDMPRKKETSKQIFVLFLNPGGRT